MSDEAKRLRERLADLDNILDQFELLNRLVEDYRHRCIDEHFECQRPEQETVQ